MSVGSSKPYFNAISTCIGIGMSVCIDIIEAYYTPELSIVGLTPISEQGHNVGLYGIVSQQVGLLQ